MLKEALKSMVPAIADERRRRIEALVQAYIGTLNSGDIDARSALFSAQGSTEDPVGNPPIVGHEARKAFWGGGSGLKAKAQLDSLIISGASEAAYRFTVELSAGSEKATLTPFVTIQINEEGLIEKMRVHFDRSSIT